MAKRKKTITAGRLVKTILYTAPEPRDTERARAEKSHMTAAAQQRMNDKAARGKLEMLPWGHRLRITSISRPVALITTWWCKRAFPCFSSVV